MKRARWPLLAEFLGRTEQALRPTAVNQRAGLGRPENRFEIQHPLLVLGNDGHALAVLAKLIKERHRGALPATVEELPIGAGRIGLGDHGQHRRNPDAACNKDVSRTSDQREVVAWSANPYHRARRKNIMHAFRAAATVRRAQYADSPDVWFRRTATQRVLANELLGENQINMCARRPCR